MGVSRKTLLVDANNLLIRAIKAMEGRRLSANGVPTGAVNTFIRTLSFWVRDQKPDRMLVAWDGGRSTYRSAIFPAYKATRASHPEYEDPEGPFALAKEFLSLANIRHVEYPGVEADDIIATYWTERLNDERLVILSADKDFLQLLDGWTEQIRPGTGVDELWTANRVRTEMQCKPEHLPYVMALTGDHGDDVPGVPGFGMKTACKWLGRYDWDLDKLVIDGSRKQPKLIGQRDVVQRNFKLVNLRQAIPGVQVSLAPKFEPTVLPSLLAEDLMRFLDRYELRWVRERFVSNELWT
jgi:DNA polymerase I